MLYLKKKTIALRIPGHPVEDALLAELGEPMLSATLSLDPVHSASILCARGVARTVTRRPPDAHGVSITDGLTTGTRRSVTLTSPGTACTSLESICPRWKSEITVSSARW